MSRRVAGLVAWSLMGTFLVLLGLTALLTLVAPPRPGVDGFSASAGFFAVAVLGFMTMGALLASRLPSNPLGWLFCGFALLQVFGSAFTFAYAVAGLPAADVAAWLTSWTWIPGIGLIGLALLLFPDGGLPTRRWRPVLWATCAGMAVAVGVGAALWPQRGLDLLTVDDQYPGAAGVLSNVALPLIFGSFMLSALSVLVRFRRARAEQRLQLKWLVFAVALTAATLVSFAVEDIVFGGGQSLLGELLGALAVAGIPVAVCMAVLRYRLYDIDRIISRTVSYAVLTAVLGGVYAGGVVLLGSLRAGSDLAVAGATLAVAAAFGPLRRRVQAVVDRRFNRARYDALATVAAFRDRLRDAVDLDQLANELQAAVNETVQPTRVDLWLRQRAAR